MLGYRRLSALQGGSPVPGCRAAQLSEPGRAAPMPSTRRPPLPPRWLPPRRSGWSGMLEGGSSPRTLRGRGRAGAAAWGRAEEAGRDAGGAASTQRSLQRPADRPAACKPSQMQVTHGQAGRQPSAHPHPTSSSLCCRAWAEGGRGPRARDRSCANRHTAGRPAGPVLPAPPAARPTGARGSAAFAAQPAAGSRLWQRQPTSACVPGRRPTCWPPGRSARGSAPARRG